MANNELQLTIDSLRTELAYYKDKPYECLYEYIWNSFDAGATEIKINFILPKIRIADCFGFMQMIRYLYLPGLVI